MVSGQLLKTFRERHEWRNLFESMRLFYVAATRAEDYLILSGASSRRIKLDGKAETWLTWLMKALELSEDVTAGLLSISESLRVNVFVNLASDVKATGSIGPDDPVTSHPRTAHGDWSEAEFPLMKKLEPERTPFSDESGTAPVTVDKSVKLRRALHRFSVHSC